MGPATAEMKTGLEKLWQLLKKGGTRLAVPDPSRGRNDFYEDALRRTWATLLQGARTQNLSLDKVVPMDEECENAAHELIRQAEASWGCAPGATPAIASVRRVEINGLTYPHRDMVAMGSKFYVVKYSGGAHTVQLFTREYRVFRAAEVPVDGCYTIRTFSELAHGVSGIAKRALVIIGLKCSVSEKKLCKLPQYHYTINSDDHLVYTGPPERKEVG